MIAMTQALQSPFVIAWVLRPSSHEELQHEAASASGPVGIMFFVVCALTQNAKFSS